MRIHRKFLDYFEGRYQLIIRNVENFAEHITPPFNYATIVIFFLSWFSISFGFSLWLAKTVLARWMNPIYIETENQKKILSLAATIETLEAQITSQTKFIAALQKLMQGKSTYTPSNPVLSGMPELIDDELKKDSSPVVPIKSKRPIKKKSLFLFPPINGKITQPFHREAKHYGIDIVAGEKSPIKAISTGIVILSDWSVDTGWVIVIQHYNNVVSICKHCAILFKKVGNLVRAGDVIALMGNSGEISTGPHLHFELWSKGVPLNPEDYINA